MRIDRVKIIDYKNLKDFTINLDKSKMETILLGQNATGKSNFIEALVLIFKHLDLESKPPFEYKIEYELRNFQIKVECINSRYKFQANTILKANIHGEKKKLVSLNSITNKEFFVNKNIYLPKYVFTYYSGVSNKLKDHFDDHQKRFYEKSIKKGVTKDDVEDLRRLFYVQLVHSYFVLLAYFSFDDEEKSSSKFLSEILNIKDLESILFVLNKPHWGKKGTFWGAKGLVNEFLQKVWEYSLAPIYNEENIPLDFRRSAKRELLYLFIKGKDELREIASFYNSNTDFFKALESTYISDLIFEVRVKVKKQGVKGDITFKELSEGEQQLLTVLGLLKFTRDEESLILLDEPDTHLNPIWKWKYREFLKDVVNKPETTQIIMNTHDPLVIGSLVKEEVRVFKRDMELKKVVAAEPEVDPKGLGVAGILTSELFGLSSTLDKETLGLLKRRNELISKQDTEELSDNERAELRALFEHLSSLGINTTDRDPLYQKFIVAVGKREEFFIENPTEENIKRQNEIAMDILNEIISEEGGSE
ncbi:AAA family ATPase [Muricauda oceani]|uniref:AAA family ATPase n=1 Tax=Flagellimonas oceani TaxID=2698672 RepID=A0A6G7IZ19_9FLAO|nr:AAA family ATPase [Allomuricauda oceani]MBW8244836.1 AAA family ATPase [Allomuricauda oceani]QII43853.1 AAA family ATPase [Allomuricauda oceani]